MCGTAIAQLHLSSDEFYNLTPLEYDYAINAYITERDNDSKFALTTMRMQTFYLLNIQLDNNSRFNSPEEMMPFSWEISEDKVVIELDENDWAELEKKYSKWNLN